MTWDASPISPAWTRFLKASPMVSGAKPWLWHQSCDHLLNHQIWLALSNPFPLARRIDEKSVFQSSLLCSMGTVILLDSPQVLLAVSAHVEQLQWVTAGHGARLGSLRVPLLIQTPGEECTSLEALSGQQMGASVPLITNCLCLGVLIVIQGVDPASLLSSSISLDVTGLDTHSH